MAKGVTVTLEDEIHLEFKKYCGSRAWTLGQGITELIASALESERAPEPVASQSKLEPYISFLPPPAKQSMFVGETVSKPAAVAAVKGAQLSEAELVKARELNDKLLAERVARASGRANPL